MFGIKLPKISSRLKFGLSVTSILATQFIAIASRGRHDGLYFTDSFCNGVMSVALMLAWLPLLCLLELSNIWRKIVAGLMFCFCGLLTLLFVFVTAFGAEQEVGRCELTHSALVANRGDQGAFGYGAISIDQQTQLLPGLMWVHPVDYKNAIGVAFSKRGDDQVDCEFEYQDGRRVKTTVKLSNP